MANTATRTQAPAPQVADLPAGTLVVVEPLPNYPRIPARSGVVVDAWGPAETASTVLVWFWGLGAPEPGKSVHAIFPAEIKSLGATLATMPEGAFQAVERGLTTTGAPLANTLAPLAQAVEAARAERTLRR